METFASVDDYEVRYGGVADEDRLTAILEDATAFLAGELRRGGKQVDESDELQKSSLRRICCRIAHDQMSVPDDMAGVTQASWSAQPYSGSWTFSAASGKAYLYRDERRELGIGSTKVGSVPPRGEASDG